MCSVHPAIGQYQLKKKAPPLQVNFAFKFIFEFDIFRVKIFKTVIISHWEQVKGQIDYKCSK